VVPAFAGAVLFTLPSRSLSAEQITEAVLEERLPHSLPEPDLMLQFDSSLVLMGALPWHLRLTEIMFVIYLRRDIIIHVFFFFIARSLYL
jgi:undecaprenyl pyrophosphate synthase